MNKKTKKRFIIILSGLLTFLLVLTIAQSVVNRHRQNEKVYVINRYIAFQDDVEAIVYNNITLVNGYLAYIKSDDTVTQEKTTTFLDYLIQDQAHLIRNIGIIEDTTIVWNYPLEGNEASIGVNLANVPGQREAILLTKEEGKSIFQGPVDLVQGGIGFIVRLPVHRQGQYWGQVSIVIDGDAFYRAIAYSAKENNIEVALYDIKAYPDTYFYTTSGFIDDNTLRFDLRADLIDWMIDVSPVNGWRDYNNVIIGIFFLSLFMATGASYLMHRHLLIQETTRFQANHDFLTGLWNRNYLEDYQEMVFNEASQSGENLAIIVIDIDTFKVINDNYGHHVGDKVLIWVAKKLKKVAQLREVVFRLGGDEFLIVLPKIRDLSYVYGVYERIGMELLEQFQLKDVVLDISLSIGHAVYPEDGQDIDDLMRIADQMMYERKKEKRMDP